MNSPESYIRMASAVAEFSTCVRRKVGAVIVSRDGRLLAMNWNKETFGACDKGDCPRGLASYLEVAAGSNYSNCISKHAEVGALEIANKMHPRLVERANIYVTCRPCQWCENALLEAGIQAIYWKDELE